MTATKCVQISVVSGVVPPIALSKEKASELVGEWTKSLVNHLYWSAKSKPSGDGELIKAKCLSTTSTTNTKDTVRLFHHVSIKLYGEEGKKRNGTNQ